MEELFQLGIKALIINSEGKIILLRINPEDFQTKVQIHCDLPGGKVRKGESIQDALKREVAEEIGLTDITIGELLDASISNMRISYMNAGLILFTYLCSIKDTQSIKLTDNEHTDFGWFPPKEAAKLLSFKFSKSLVNKVKKL